MKFGALPALLCATSALALAPGALARIPTTEEVRAGVLAFKQDTEDFVADADEFVDAAIDHGIPAVLVRNICLFFIEGRFFCYFLFA